MTGKGAMPRKGVTPRKGAMPGKGANIAKKTVVGRILCNIGEKNSLFRCFRCQYCKKIAFWTIELQYWQEYLHGISKRHIFAV